MTTPPNSLWITFPEARPEASLRLFCFPYAGGAASAFWNWPADLPQEVEVCPVQLPSRGNRLLESPFLQMKTLIKSLSAAILPFLDRPFAFFGHSMGAIMSFELACSLRSVGAPVPIHIFASGSRAPHIPERKTTYHLPEAELLEVLRELNGTPDEMLNSPEFRRVFLPLLRTDLAVDETYLYTARKPLRCLISAYGGLQDKEVSAEDIEAWSVHTTGAFSVRMFPGDHFFLRSCQPALLQTLSEELRQHRDARRQPALQRRNTASAG